MKPKTKWIVIAVVVIALASYGTYLQMQGGQKETIKIGGAFALSGFATEWGEAELKGATLAIEEANNNGGINGKRIELVTEDIGSENTRAVSAVLKLINSDKVLAVVGPTWLDTFAGAAPLADEYSRIMITPSASITAIKSQKNFRYVFSTWYRTDAEVEKLLEHLSGAEKKKVVLLFGNDPFWQDVSNQIREKSSKYDIKLAEEYKFISGETDFRTILVRIKEIDHDATIFGLNDEQGLLSFLQQRSTLYPEAQLYTTEYIEEFASKANYQGLLENLSFVSPEQVSGDFAEKYREIFGAEPVFSASNSYDATKIILEALAANTSSEAAKNYIAANSFNTSTFGIIHFDEIGGISGGTFVIKKIENNEIAEVG